MFAVVCSAALDFSIVHRLKVNKSTKDVKIYSFDIEPVAAAAASFYFVF